MPIEPKYSRWSIRVLAPDGTARGQVTTHRKFGIVRRFNAPSDWAMVVDAADPVAALLSQPQWGISAARTVYSQVTNQVLLSRDEIVGPATGIQRTFGAQTLTINGKDDLWKLVGRDAWPVTNYPFAGDVVNANCKLWWRMDASSGTSETDASGNSNTGTYANVGTGTFVLNQPSLIDDLDHSVQFNGSGTANGATLTQGAKTPATITGNYTVFIVAKNGTTGKLCGSRGPTNQFGFEINISGTSLGAVIGDGSGAWIALPSVTVTWPTAGPYVICWVVTTTGWTVYLGGVQVGSGTYAAATPVLWDAGHTFRVGNSGFAGDPYCNGGIDEVIIYNTNFLPATAQQLSLEALTRFAKSAYDTITGPCETVLKHYVNLNAGPGALAERQVAGLVVDTDLGTGATTYGNARWDKLVRSDGTGLLQLLALTSGMGFKIASVGGVRTFKTFTPADKTASVFFSTQLENLIDYDYAINSPDPETGGNVQVVGGGGNLTQRAITIQSDSNSIATWGRFEQFLDARDTTDVATMVQRGLAALTASGFTSSFHSTTAPSPQTVYGIDYDLGDKVSAIIESPPTVTSGLGPLQGLVLCVNASASTTLPTANIFLVNPIPMGGGTNAATSLIGTATGWSELTTQGTASAWSAAGSMPAQSGRGAIDDSTALENTLFQAGTWTIHVRGIVSVGTATGDLWARVSVRHSNGTYTAIGSVSLAAQTYTTSYNTFFLVGALPGFSLSVGDKLYIDFFFNCTANGTGSGAATINFADESLDGGIHQGAETDTPGYQAYQLVPPPIVFQDVIREVDITIEENKEEVVQPILGTPNAVLIRDALMRYLRRTQQTTNTLTRLQTRQ